MLTNQRVDHLLNTILALNQRIYFETEITLHYKSRLAWVSVSK